jgi:tetratricopeptide (TPR) repeat protein
MSVKEDPEDDRNAFYYARELFYYGKLEEAAVEFKRHLALPRATWNVERSSSMRFLSKCDTDNAEHWLKMSINEAPGSREPLIDLSEYYYKKSKWDKSIEYADKALEIKEKPLIYLCESDSWTWKPHDLKAIALYNIGRYKEAEAEGKIALSFMPDNDRLKNNLEFYKKSL